MRSEWVEYTLRGRPESSRLPRDSCVEDVRPRLVRAAVGSVNPRTLLLW